MATVLEDKKLSSDELATMVQKTKENAMMNGVLMRLPESPGKSEKLTFAPLTLFPSVIPGSQLNHIKSIQTNFGRLMHKVACDYDFLHQCLKNVVKVDEFINKLWEIYEIVRREGTRQPICLGIFRNDYMMDVKSMGNGPSEKESREISDVLPSVEMKQIEFNMIASSFGGIVTPVTKVHRYNLIKCHKKFEEWQFPSNQPTQSFAEALQVAWQLYGNKEACVLFLVSDPEQNRPDQCWLEIALFDKNPKISVVYRSMAEVAAHGQLRDNKLFVDNKEVAVIYMRVGYSPTDYPSEQEWDARLMMERSQAIKCPPVHYQLAGCKKVQQELCRPGAVEKFITEQADVDDIRKTFVTQYSLDEGPEGDQAINIGMTNFDKFVLKPNREGGGNNIYGANIPPMLEKIKGMSERSGYILMERIFPWLQKNYMIKAGIETGLHNVVSEIGIYSTYIGTAKEEMLNELSGHLVRTKTLGTDEGGIIKGFSCLDSPFLM